MKECKFNMNKEDGRNEHLDMIEERANMQERVTETKFVLSLWGLFCVPNSSVCARSHVQFPVTEFKLKCVQRQRRMSWPQSGNTWNFSAGKVSHPVKDRVKQVRKASIFGEHKKDGQIRAVVASAQARDTASREAVHDVMPQEVRIEAPIKGSLPYQRWH